MGLCNTVIVGAGGHGQVVYDAWKASQRHDPSFPVTMVGWLETPEYEGPDDVFGHPVYRDTPEGWAALHRSKVTHCYLGFGMTVSAPSRWRVIETLIQKGVIPLTLLHPSACISPDAIIGMGCFVGARSVVQPFASVGEAAILNTGSIVEHHAQVGRNTHIAPGAVLCGKTRVGSHCLIGANAVLIQGVSVGDGTTVGAGSVVIRDLPSRVTAVGNPAVAQNPEMMLKG